MYILQEEENFYDLASCDTRVTKSTDEFTLRFSGVKGDVCCYGNGEDA